MATALLRADPPRPPGRPWPVGPTTIHVGDPCPYCGQTEVHEVTFGGPDRGTVCQPGETRRGAGEAAYALLFGMEAAADLLDDVPRPLWDRLNELRTQAALADPIPHDGLYRGA